MKKNKYLEDLRKNTPESEMEKFDKAFESLKKIEQTIEPFKPPKMIRVNTSREKWTSSNHYGPDISIDI
jgi:hypothetical protein